jgi:hypothetical protein
MKRIAVAVAGVIWTLISLAGLASAQSKPPVIFDVSEVVVGAQRIPTLFAHTAGKWSDARQGTGYLATDIQCFKRLAFCADADAFPVESGDLGGRQANVSLDTYDIVRWDDNELIAVDSTPMCDVRTIRFDFRKKMVSYTSTLKNEDAVCKGAKTTTAFLEGVK